MATEESSLTDFEYRIVGIESLKDRVYNQHHHAVSAIVHSAHPRNRAALRQNGDIEKFIEVRHVMRSEWKSNIREVFGLE